MRHPPTWACAWGEDRCGRWAALELSGVEARLRWIPPGRFPMGSPEDEADRHANEALHIVTLTEGFWLAATTVTQTLWEAVTGQNPSHFRGSRRPVDNVSWDDCDAFLRCTEELVPGLGLRFPTEAEWEFACRAATPTPFSFGDSVSTDQVNYDGNHPYRERDRGAYRQQTVDVGSLPANPWGLFEMHGNVREWCCDWFGDYPTSPVLDPVGPSEGAGRVLRGGSWISLARGCRSAVRLWSSPDLRIIDFGFRFARGPGESRE